VIAFAAAHGNELRLDHAVWRFRRTEPGKEAEAARALLSSGAYGQRALEAVAFDREAAPGDSAIRQAALDVIYEQDVSTSGVLDGPDERRVEERLASYLHDARGLRRAAALRWLPPTATTDALLDAEIDALSDPDLQVSLEAWLHLSMTDNPRSLAARRRAAFDCPHVDIRGLAAGRLAQDPDSRSLAERTLADPAESVRFWSAYWLAEKFHDAVGLAVLVVVFRSHGPHGIQEPAVRALLSLDDRRSIAALVAASKSFPSFDAIYAALERLTGVKSGSITDWPAWLKAHRAELPPQLDPETTPVAPIQPASKEPLAAELRSPPTVSPGRESPSTGSLPR
jgi:hypothetical protein